MTVKIGHASIDENKKSKGGAAGDQTVKEVCIRKWYDKGWSFVLRPRNITLAEKSAKACEQACANANVGYDQNQRNTLYAQAKRKAYDLSKINVPCECDCSSLMTVCAIAGGSSVAYVNNAPTTSTMKEKFMATGEYECLTDDRYLTSDKSLKRGDILVKVGSHTVMVLENGSLSNTNISSNPYAEPTRTIKRISPTMKGEDVKWVQWHLNRHGYDIEIDGSCGSLTEKAIKKFQKKSGITVDGKVGGITRKYLKK